jgi:plasmid stabilization system protein ParE
MSLPVRWTTEAEESFAKIIEHLEETWSEKEVRKFIRTVNKVLKQISGFPRMYEASAANPGVRKGFIAKQCSLFYEIKEDSIVLLFFWDNRRKPF